VRLHANTLSEIWQPVGWLAHAKFHPNGDRYRVHDFIRRAREKGSHAADLSEGEDDESHEGTRVFLDHADQLMAWMKKIDDPNWGYEIIHVAKQVEEYAEEIRDGGRMPELGLPYVEHCLPSFIAYCEWFKRLPWDDTEQSISAEELLVSIRRDIEVARREILYPENQDPPGFVERCARQVRRNAAALSARLTEDDGSASPRARVAGSLVEDSERLEDQVRDFVLRCAVLEEMSELAKQRLGLLDAVRDLPEQTREFARYCGGSELENINAATSQLQQLKTQHDGWIDRRAEYRTALRCAPEGTPPLGDALVNRLSNMLELCTRLSENPDTATEP
jgi:hypothetical protein